MTTSQTGRIPDRNIPADLVAAIEAWRLAQPVPPNKTQAVIYLLRRGLAAVSTPNDKA